MRKRAILFSMIIFFTTHILAQGKYVDSLKDWINKHPEVDSQYIQTLHRLSYRLNEVDIQQSYAYYERVSLLSDSLNFTFGKSLAQINLALLLSSSANFNGSNNAYFKAVDYAEACGANRLKAISLNNIADNFFSLYNYEKCRNYTNEALPINIKLKAWRGVAINYELLSRCDFREQKYEDAYNNLMKGMPYAMLANESYIFSQFYLGYAKLNAVADRTDSAKYYFAKALQQAIPGGEVRNQLDVYFAEAQTLKNISPGNKLGLLDSALTIAKKTGYYEGIYNAADELSKVYLELKNKDSALAYFEIYRSALDSMFSLNKSFSANVAEWIVRRKDVENDQLKEFTKLQKKQLVFKNALLLSVLILLGLVVVVAFFINKSIQSKKKKSELAFKQKIAESQIQSLRAQMNPHFIFNSLNSIENFMMQNEKRKASDYLHKFSLLIRTILESSRSEMTTVLLDMEALKLYVDLEQMRYNNKFKYYENIDAQLQNDDYNVPSLLIQPYVENAIVHGIAHSENTDLKLAVTATLENEYIKYIIEDNGVGRSQSKAYNKINKLHHKSVGLKITEDRIKLFNQEDNLNGYVKIMDLYDNNHTPAGTRIEVKIKAI